MVDKGSHLGSCGCVVQSWDDDARKIQQECDYHQSLRAQRDELVGVVRRLLKTHPWGGIDEADLQDLLVEEGILEPVTITEIPCEAGCNCIEVDAQVGDICYRPTEWIKQALANARESENAGS